MTTAKPETLRDEKIANLETTIRFYAAAARRWENRCIALQFQVDTLEERLAAAGYTAYGQVD